ncbi:MAG TPA: hypothetical protein VG028_20245 [Terriglobia bacterium]|nr:hypothetical protein [Terriglobia bacterium]
MLADTQNIAVRVFEPSHLGTAGRGPDSLLVLIWQTVTLKVHSFFPQAGNQFLNIVDFPPKDCELLWLEFRDFGCSDHNPIAIQNQGECIFADEPKPQNSFIKRSRFPDVSGGNKSHDSLGTQHECHLGSQLITGERDISTHEDNLHQLECKRKVVDKVWGVGFDLDKAYQVALELSKMPCVKPGKN